MEKQAKLKKYSIKFEKEVVEYAKYMEYVEYVKAWLTNSEYTERVCKSRKNKPTHFDKLQKNMLAPFISKQVEGK